MECFRSGVDKIAIVITDGESNLDSGRTISDAEAARAAGIEIISIGVTDAVNMAEVSGISSLPQTLDYNYYLIEDFTTLSDVVQHIVDSTCTGNCMLRLHQGNINNIPNMKFLIAYCNFHELPISSI